MKKIVFSILAISTLLVGCRDDDNNSLLDTSAERYISQDQLDDLISQFPEKAMNVTSGFEDGNNKYLVAYQANHAKFGYMSILLGLEHMTNDMVAARSHHISSTYYTYLARNVNNTMTDWVWSYYYKVVYNMNQIIKNLPSNPTEQNAKHIKGRALAMRALSYLDLVRLYGGDKGIPYYSESVESKARLATTTVMDHIEEDLKTAYRLLADYDRQGNKQSIDKNVVAGFLARYYLEVNNPTQAAQYAALARAGYSPMSTTDLLGGFDKINNPEWMWGADIDGSTSTIYASFFSHIGNRNGGYAGLLKIYRSIDKRLYNEISPTDIRRNWFVDDGNTYNLPKYANVKFYDASGTSFLGDYVFMRASEMYFIEAEAYAQAGQDGRAQQVLFDIMSKRDPNYVRSTKTGDDLLKEIRINKRIELWGEGQNFFDHKRWGYDLDRTYEGTNHPIFGQKKYSAGDKIFTFEIPQSELDANKEVSN